MYNMIREWGKFRGWTVLEHFLLCPNSKIHINELGRALKIAPSTARIFCNGYHVDGLLNKTGTGNIHQFFLNESDARVQALKKFMGPYLVSDSIYLNPFLEKNRNVLSVSIYGSFATGEYGDKSDLDILALKSDDRKLETDGLAKIELRLGREVGVTGISLAKWREMERKKDNFFLSIRKKNVLVWGNPI